MAELIIYLHPEHFDQSLWRIGSDIHQGELERLREKAEGYEVCVFVSARQVLLLQAQLPEMPRARLLQALPFALEEELVSDVNELHFAAGRQDREGRIAVAITDKEKMQRWLADLQMLNITPQWLGSSIFAVPYNVDTWHIVLIKDMAMVRTQAELGFSCDIANLNAFLQTAIKESEIPPQALEILNYTTTSLNLDLTQPVHETKYPEDDFFKSMQTEELTGINLLQGKYAQKNTARFSAQLGWKVAGALGCLMVLLLFLKPIGSNIILGQALSSVNKKIAMIYKRHFPESTKIVAARERLHEKWQHLTEAGSQNQVLLLLSDIHQAMTKAASIKLKRFDYQNNAASLELQAGSSEELTQFTEALSALGLTVKQENANLSEGKISASIQISTT